MKLNIIYIDNIIEYEQSVLESWSDVVVWTNNIPFAFTQEFNIAWRHMYIWLFLMISIILWLTFQSQ
jgi:hypothetical protein